MLALTGVGVAIVTPFDNSGSIDFDALGKVIEYIIESKVDYVVTLGTTGETATLTEGEKLLILNYTYDAINGRIPVVVGIGGNNPAEVMHVIKTMPLEKAAAIL